MFVLLCLLVSLHELVPTYLDAGFRFKPAQMSLPPQHHLFSFMARFHLLRRL